MTWHTRCKLAAVFARRLALALFALFGCGGAESSVGPVHIVSGVLVYDGSRVTAALNLRVDAVAATTTFAWHVGALPAHGLRHCAAQGWRLDVVDSSSELTPNESRDVALRARSYDRPACDPSEPVARCGDRVWLVVMTDDDVPLATLDTTFICLFRVP